MNTNRHIGPLDSARASGFLDDFGYGQGIFHAAAIIDFKSTFKIAEFYTRKKIRFYDVDYDLVETIR